jgi:hypothetical protein
VLILGKLRRDHWAGQSSPDFTGLREQQQCEVQSPPDWPL